VNTSRVVANVPSAAGRSDCRDLALVRYSSQRPPLLDDLEMSEAEVSGLSIDIGYSSHESLLSCRVVGGV
jgi:hypothetical protein